MHTPNCTPMMVLGGCALLTATGLVVIVAIGLRAVALGRDVVWECSWQLPIRLMTSVQNLRHIPLRMPDPRRLAAALPYRPSWTMRPAGQGQFRLPRAMPIPFGLQSLAGVPAGGRRPVRARHYQTVGERMRAQTASRRWAA